jgi:deoxyribodipyrimidine photolyase-related protein
MLLCEINPDVSYQWFMELFIDSYDWVIVPNVYVMNHHADGGLMTTKPYISGSSYVSKMSDFRSGPWRRSGTRSMGGLWQCIACISPLI